MVQPGRKYQAGTGSYRYSINGQEKDSELNENITTALYWEYDSRIGRRWNNDPKPDASLSVYVSFGNNPIINTDQLGDTLVPFKFKYLPVTGNTEGRNPIASGVENVFRFAYNNTVGAVAGIASGGWNTATNQSSNAKTNIIHEFDKSQKGAYDYHTRTPVNQQLKDLGAATTDLRTYDLPAQLFIVRNIPYLFRSSIAVNTDISTVYHSTSTISAADNILTKGIDPSFFKSNARFGRGFYVSNDIKTTVLELGKHGATRASTIQFSLNKPVLLNATGKFLNLTTHMSPKLMGAMARSFGLDGIMYNSAISGASGTNVVLFKNFQKLKNATKVK